MCWLEQVRCSHWLHPHLYVRRVVELVLHVGRKDTQSVWINLNLYLRASKWPSATLFSSQSTCSIVYPIFLSACFASILDVSLHGMALYRGILFQTISDIRGFKRFSIESSMSSDENVLLHSPQRCLPEKFLHRNTLNHIKAHCHAMPCKVSLALLVLNHLLKWGERGCNPYRIAWTKRI